MTHPASTMTRYVCATCGTQYADSARPPASCRVCTDDRQHVGSDGQHWTNHDELAATLHNRIETDGDLVGVGIIERFAIPQRALLLPTDAGNILWDCVSVITPDAIDEITRLGGIDLIAISHPHFYSAMVEWSDAFGGAPILVHEADRDWIARSSPHITTWTGDRRRLSATVELIHCPGHFPGSAVLHWTEAPHGKRVLLTGDSLHVAADRRYVSVMHSVPNYIPVAAPVIHDIRRRLAGIEFDDVYGFTWGLNIIGSARAAVDESLDRYLSAIGATGPVPRSRNEIDE
jgi:glyoxylase-like metal-dependent hydrolase (beta-lactamase superfamily II)